MLILLDNGTPRGIAHWLENHIVKESREQGWDALGNGELLNAAEVAGFEVLVTTGRICVISKTSQAGRLRLSSWVKAAGVS